MTSSFLSLSFIPIKQPYTQSYYIYVIVVVSFIMSSLTTMHSWPDNLKEPTSKSQLLGCLAWSSVVIWNYYEASNDIIMVDSTKKRTKYHDHRMPSSNLCIKVKTRQKTLVGQPLKWACDTRPKTTHIDQEIGEKNHSILIQCKQNNQQTSLLQNIIEE